MAYKNQETFTKIPDWYWQCGLSLLEVNIIARIASWQRDNKEFYEGYDKLAALGWGHYNTIRNTFLKLEKDGIIKKNGKVKRAWKWKIVEYKLQSLKDSNNRCKNNERYLQPELEILTPDVSYNTNKTSNKTSFIERESKEDSLSMAMKAEMALKDLDI